MSLYPPTVGAPGQQKAACTHHCPQCKREWELRRGNCPVCEAKLIKGKLPILSMKQAIIKLRKEVKDELQNPH